MTLKLFTDNARSFTFKHDFETMDHAQTISCAILGYMVGTYEQPTIETTISNNEANNAYTLVIDYVADNDLTKVFNRICDSYSA